MSPFFRTTFNLCAGVPSTSSVPRYSTVLPFAFQSANGPPVSVSSISAFTSSADMRSGSLRPKNGDTFQPSFPSYASICVIPWSEASVRTSSGRLFTCTKVSSTWPCTGTSNFPESRTVWRLFSAAAPPLASMFLATSSSTVGWLLSCAKIADAKSAVEMKEVKKRRDISNFPNQCGTLQHLEYSKNGKASILQNIFGRRMQPRSGLDSKIIYTITPRAVPGLDQHVSPAAQGPNMQSMRSMRAKPLRRQAKQDCE